MIRHLETIQTQEILNEVCVMDEPGPGGANHSYLIKTWDEDNLIVGTIQFQKGARKEETSTHGVIDSDLLEIVRDRLKAFQSGPFASEYNQEALEGVEKALHALNKRVEDRIARNVLGHEVK